MKDIKKIYSTSHLERIRTAEEFMDELYNKSIDLRNKPKISIKQCLKLNPKLIERIK